MKTPRRALAPLLAALLAGALVTACGSTNSGGGGEPMIGAGATLVDRIEDGDPVSGNVQVTWRNLDPANKDVVISLVNESSEYGQRLRSGRSTSTVTRVATDEQMGQLLATLREMGFFEHATPMVLGALPDEPGRKGAVVVQQGGESVGLMLVRKQGLAGSQIPKIYTESKRLIIGLHSSLQGLEVRTNQDDDVFSMPPIQPPGR